MIEQQMKAKLATNASGPSQQAPQQQQQPQQQQSAANSADYSAQWAEYYRSVGKIEEAEAIEKTLKTKVRHLSLSLKFILHYLNYLKPLQLL